MDEHQESETTLGSTIVATARATGSFNNPFDRVDFWMEDVNGPLEAPGDCQGPRWPGR